MQTKDYIIMVQDLLSGRNEEFDNADKEGTEKLKPTIKLKVDDGDIAVLPFIFCLF